MDPSPAAVSVAALYLVVALLEVIRQRGVEEVSLGEAILNASLWPATMTLSFLLLVFLWGHEVVDSVVIAFLGHDD